MFLYFLHNSCWYLCTDRWQHWRWNNDISPKVGEGDGSVVSSVTDKYGFLAGDVLQLEVSSTASSSSSPRCSAAWGEFDIIIIKMFSSLGWVRHHHHCHQDVLQLEGNKLALTSDISEKPKQILIIIIISDSCGCGDNEKKGGEVVGDAHTMGRLHAAQL